MSDAFKNGQFSDLEAAAERLRQIPFVTFADGTPGLSIFYDGLSARYADISSPEKWELWRSGFDAWAKAYPLSPTRPVAEAESFIVLAWQYRGGSYAAHVTEAGRRGHVEHLGNAYKLLKEAPQNCPHRPYAMMTVALGQGWRRNDYEVLYQSAVSRWPSYRPFYQNKTVYLLPRWYGSRGEMAAWAKEEMRLDRSGLGEVIYAIVADEASRYTYETNHLVETEGFDWPTIRTGLRKLIAATPRSAHNAFRAAEWAWKLNDKDAAVEFFTPVIGKQRGGTLSEGEFVQLKTWLGLDGTSAKTLSNSPSAVFKTPTNRDSLILALVTTADGHHVIVGDLGGTLTKLTLPELKLVKQVQLHNDAGCLRLAPDGKRIAVGMNSYTSEIIELDAQTLSQLGMPRRIEGELTDFDYTRNGEFVCALGTYNKHPSASVMDRKGRVQVKNWLAPGLSFISSVSVNRAANLAGFTDSKGIPLYDLNNNELVHRIIAPTGLEPRVLVFCSTGQSLAYIAQGKTVPSVLAIVRGPDWSSNSAYLRTGPRGSISCMAWSPDRRWIAVGGDSGQIWLWSADGGDAHLVGKNMKWIRALEFSPDSQWLISGSDDHMVRVWDLRQLESAANGPEAPKRSQDL